ncbi:oligosaccharide flippase family protein [Ruegeria conchae]|uniref:O-antigen/teichoic acid export membrane protein n=1 Tax=Ruegeria conchae TaxID=981384 RepID=A0A497ZHR9_9RHOB|nr:oligosaccharide flippase family protein [Ruegeria conchae]RLK07342.1 O-antigen/teichoic acid export membrane protein [Ruegeria conchae]
MKFISQRISGLMSDRDSLRRKIMASAALSTMVFVMQVMARIVSTIVLTRILTPEIFGVFAVVMTFIFVLEMFSDLGVRSLILTREGELDDGFLRSCWTAQILRGVLILLVCILLAFGISWGQGAEWFDPKSSYGDPTLPFAIAAIGGFSIISGFASPAKFVYEREMKFRQVSKETLIRVVLTTVITIGLAFWLRNIWALVLGNLAGAVIMVTLSYAMFIGPAMRLSWSVDDFRVIIERGKWIIGHSALSAVTVMADRFVLGFAMSASSFGFYYIARQIVDIVETFLNTVHAQMGLQVFTELHKDGEEASLRRRYYRYRILFDSLAMFGAGTLMTFAPTLVGIIYDDRYADVAGMIQILSVGLILIGPRLLREAYSAQRRFREMTVLSLVSAATIWVGLFIAIWGFGSTTLALIVVALHRIPEVTALLVMGRREGWVSLLHEVRLMPLVLVGAAVGWGMAELWAAAT